MSKTPARAPAPRPHLLKAADEAIRKLGAQAVLVSDLVATRVGLNSTDLECLDLLHLAGATTAGQLSTHTGLTTGATTAVIDRLERAGFVTRRRDPNDRRVVLVEVLEHSGPQIEPFYRPIAKLMSELNRRYDDRELETVVAYLTEALEAGAKHVTWLQTQPALVHKRCRLHGVASELIARALGGGRPASASPAAERATPEPVRAGQNDQEPAPRPARRK